jgi:hypothetical protein
MTSLQRTARPQVWPKEYYFMLVNGRARSQTSGIMKNLPGKLKLVALTAIGVVVMLIIQACAPFTLKLDHGLFALIITCPQQIQSVDKFEAALKRIQHRGVTYDFHLVPESGTPKDYHYESRIAIKTDRVITTELTKNLSREELTAIGSSLTHHVYSPSAEDIAIVLDQIKK